MKNYYKKEEFELGLKTYKKSKKYFRFELSNGDSVLEGNDIIEKALSRSVTKNKNLNYLLYNIWNHHPDNETSIILYEVTTNITKPDCEEDYWFYCIPKLKKQILEISFETLEILVNNYHFSTLNQMKKCLNKIADSIQLGCSVDI